MKHAKADLSLMLTEKNITRLHKLLESEAFQKTPVRNKTEAVINCLMDRYEASACTPETIPQAAQDDEKPNRRLHTCVGHDIKERFWNIGRDRNLTTNQIVGILLDVNDMVFDGASVNLPEDDAETDKKAVGFQPNEIPKGSLPDNHDDPCGNVDACDPDAVKAALEAYFDTIRDSVDRILHESAKTKDLRAKLEQSRTENANNRAEFRAQLNAILAQYQSLV